VNFILVNMKRLLTELSRTWLYLRLGGRSGRRDRRDGKAHSVTLYHALDNQPENLLEISANDSIGVLYSPITLQLGFDFNSHEYKIVGLAPYGDTDPVKKVSRTFDAAGPPTVTVASRGGSLVLNAGWHDQSLGITLFASVPLKRVLDPTSNDLTLAPWSQALIITMGETLHASKENQGKIVDLGWSDE
jgi:hypothetical protein